MKNCDETTTIGGEFVAKVMGIYFQSIFMAEMGTVGLNGGRMEIERGGGAQENASFRRRI